MSVATAESYASDLGTTAHETRAPSGLSDRIEQYGDRLLALAALLVSGESAGEPRRRIEGLLRAHRDELVCAIRTLRDDTRGD